MVINWHGDGCFRVQSGSSTLAIDPPSQRFKTDVTLISDPVLLPFPVGEEGVITGPGEYEVKGIEIIGVSAPNTTAYLAKMEDITLCFLGNLTGDLDAAALEKLSAVDILFIPGSGTGLDLETAAKIVKKLAPKIVIPSHFKDSKKFTKEMEYNADTEEKLTLKKKDLVEGKTRIVVLKA